MTALSVSVLLLNLLFPTVTAALTVTAAVLLFLLSVEYGNKTAIFVFIATAALSLMLLSSRPEVFCLYTFLFGLYSLLKKPLDLILSKPLRIALKLLFSVVAESVYAAAILFVFQSQAVADFFYQSLWLNLAAALLSVAVFLLYDECLTRLAKMYYIKLRPKIFPNEK